MVDGAFFKHTHFFSRLIHFMVHEAPLRQKEAYAPPRMQHRLNIHNDIGLWPKCKKETSKHNLSMKGTFRPKRNMDTLLHMSGAHFIKFSQD
jgi:hypothetical protein